MQVDDEDEQERIWDNLYNGIVAVLRTFGKEDHFGKADYLVVDDNYGWKRHTIEIHRLHMLDPAIVTALRSLLQEARDWEIVIAVDIPGTETVWPRMGLIIRQHEVVDGLQREWLPADVRRFQYEDSRTGTGYD